MSERFYTSSELTPGPVEIEGAEARHLAAVCRLREGDAVVLFNGDGADYPADVVAVGKKRVALEVTERRPVDREAAVRIEIAASLPKGDRAQFLIEKLTELGVASFVPLLCRRSIVQPSDNTIEKFERYVIEASKQCGRNVLMRIAPPTPWNAYAENPTDDLRIFAHPGVETPIAAGEWKTRPSIRCAIGPEGGFTDEEAAVARTHAWRPIHLGPRILRTETAAIALAAIVIAG